MDLTATDLLAIEKDNADHLLDKGAYYYGEGQYTEAVEYYRLAAAMGSAQAIANLGYCYLYGRELEANLSQAIAYFKIAADRRNVDAAYKSGDIYSNPRRNVDVAYKLGDIYSNPRWGVEDKELANYYFEAAGHLIMDEGFNAYNSIVTCDKLLDYPSLCLALGREKSVGGSMPTDIDAAYQFLKMAERGYQRNLTNGQTMCQKAFEAVEKMLADNQYDPVREEVDALLEED